MNTRRYSRTLQEAFGPYASGRDLQPLRDPSRWTAGQAVLCAIYALTLLVFLLVVVL